MAYLEFVNNPFAAIVALVLGTLAGGAIGGRNAAIGVFAIGICAILAVVWITHLHGESPGPAEEKDPARDERADKQQNQPDDTPRDGQALVFCGVAQRGTALQPTVFSGFAPEATVRVRKLPEGHALEVFNMTSDGTQTQIGDRLVATQTATLVLADDRLAVGAHCTDGPTNLYADEVFEILVAAPDGSFANPSKVPCDDGFNRFGPCAAVCTTSLNGPCGP